MGSPGCFPDFYELLQGRYSFHARELGQTHKALSVQYRKLAGIERTLNERQERGLKRKDKKKLQWSRALTKNAIVDLESQQAWLNSSLLQCENIIQRCTNRGCGLAAAQPTLRPPPMPLIYNPFSGPPVTPWIVNPEQGETETQPWDLRMLRDRRLSSPNTASASADSGFFEPSIYPHSHGSMDDGSIRCDYVCDGQKPCYADTTTVPRGSLSTGSSISERDEVPDLADSMSSMGSDAELRALRRRRYSENAIQFTTTRLSVSRTHRRGQSVDNISTLVRTGSDINLVGSKVDLATPVFVP
jgi:hypothetical protein